MASTPKVRALGRYLLTEPIATGTTATVWRARDKRTGSDVAVKRFHPHLFGDRSARRRMEAEAKAARRVRGRTIVSATDRIATRDEFALVFPFVDGTPLAERLRDATPLPASDAAEIAVDVADALVAIHRAGLVHRDVKPGNVLLARDGRALLLDFGISRTVADEIEAEQALTGAGLAIGTLPYMSPEQLAAHDTTAATDVYALGVLLYEMLSGKRPYEAASPVALATEQRLPPARIEDAPGPLVDLALRAMAFDAQARPTAVQLAEGLRSWLTAPVAIDAPTAPLTAVTLAAQPAARPRPLWLERHPAFVSPAVALAALLLVALVALAAISPILAPGQSTPADEPLAAIAQATASPAPVATTSVVPVVPAVVPANQPQPAKPPTTQQTPTPPPAAAPSPPSRHDGHHHNGGHHHHKHGHGHHHPKHHH